MVVSSVAPSAATPQRANQDSIPVREVQTSSNSSRERARTRTPPLACAST